MAVKSIDIIKSYLTEGKYPTASELVDIIDTLVSIGQNSGGSASYSYLELVPDLDAYTDAPVGKIVKYNGQTNNKYTRGWDYEKVSDSSSQYLHINTGDFYFQYNNTATIYNNASDGAAFMEQKGSPIYKLVEQKENIKWMYDTYSRNSVYLLDGSPVHVGDKVILVYANADGKAHDGAVITEIATVDGNTFTVVDPNNTTLTFTYVNNNNRTTIYHFINADGAECITFNPLSPVNTSEPTSQSLNMLFPNDNVYARVDWIGNISEEDTDVAPSSAPPASYSWQPITYPSAPVSSGD